MTLRVKIISHRELEKTRLIPHSSTSCIQAAAAAAAAAAGAIATAELMAALRLVTIRFALAERATAIHGPPPRQTGKVFMVKLFDC